MHLFFDLATAEKSSYEIIDPQKKGRRRSLQTFFRLLTGKHQAKQITCQGLASSSFTLFCGVAKHFFSVWRYARYRKKETRNRKCKWKKTRKENYRHALTKDEKKSFLKKVFFAAHRSFSIHFNSLKMGKRYLLWAGFRCYRVSKMQFHIWARCRQAEDWKKCVVLLLPSSSCPMCTQHVIWDNFEFLAQSAKKCLKTKNILHAGIYAFSSFFSDRKKGVCPWQLIFSRKVYMSAVLLLLYSFFPLHSEE